MLQPSRIISPPHLPLPTRTEMPPTDLSSLIIDPVKTRQERKTMWERRGRGGGEIYYYCTHRTLSDSGKTRSHDRPPTSTTTVHGYSAVYSIHSQTPPPPAAVDLFPSLPTTPTPHGRTHACAMLPTSSIDPSHPPQSVPCLGIVNIRNIAIIHADSPGIIP
ncbi:uncharacterized protein K489DRAFT_80914 [Dissoconium aciculare CBS 342.82]|uniref:Uncharacterized protein n=1 Tax=Dissoconium aciculare CBS 342.82 TaxID=1314786 RepID=A0A6J3LT48_9PEZI|nr:uncharacterized protein K489DRAFT_80914 [Dissoconium aciculare CBS 342.82]KAF1818818.1 hypothetical protein K489DRAFT_80914 [Dissoconium aciculare CBS 342.82]